MASWAPVLPERSRAPGRGGVGEWRKQGATSRNRVASPCATSDTSASSQKGWKKKRGHRGTPADLPSYFYFILQLLCPSTRWDPRNPQTKRQKGIIMAKIAGISQLQGRKRLVSRGWWVVSGYVVGRTGQERTNWQSAKWHKNKGIGKMRWFHLKWLHRLWWKIRKRCRHSTITDFLF